MKNSTAINAFFMARSPWKSKALERQKTLLMFFETPDIVNSQFLNTVFTRISAALELAPHLRQKGFNLFIFIQGRRLLK